MRKNIGKAAVAVTALGVLTGAGIVSTAGPASAAVSCTTHKGNTAGWINCTGSGTVRIIIDCKAPQITDYTGPWTTYNGSITLSGECKYGINVTTYQVR
jgi:hypothetical protein